VSKRIFGIETEFGCLTEANRFTGSPEGVAARVRDYVFHELKLGISDMHYRDWGEPPGNGGFLFNGGRLYIDMGHLEYATPECQQLFDLVAYDKAIERVITQILGELELEEEVSFFKNNVDHFTGATFGCHENYQIRRDVSFYKVVIPTLMPFFVTRQIYAGAGRVGGYEEILEFGEIQQGSDGFVGYQISQRADHIVTEIYEWIQFSRAIINTRDEPLADYTKYRRLHLLVGDSNMSEYAAALKVGTTSLVLDLIESGHRPRNLGLSNSVQAIKDVSRDQNFEWIVELESGDTISAIDLQREYLNLAQKVLKGRDDDTDWVLAAWESVLDDLEKGWLNVTDRVDWAAKKWLLETFMEEENLDWDDPWLESLDLEYHHLHPQRGLYYSLEHSGHAKRVITEERIDAAIAKSPEDTRAKARTHIMRYLFKNRLPCIVDWHQIYFTHEEPFEMKDPFYTYEAEVEVLLKRLSQHPKSTARKQKRVRLS
jgi:proteasome accessory factor A